MLRKSLKEEQLQVETLNSKVESMLAEFKRMRCDTSPDAIKLKNLTAQYDEYERSMIEQISQKDDLISSTNLNLNQTKNELIKARVEIEHLKRENNTVSEKTKLNAMKEEIDSLSQNYASLKTKWKQSVQFTNLGREFVKSKH